MPLTLTLDFRELMLKLALVIDRLEMPDLNSTEVIRGRNINSRHLILSSSARFHGDFLFHPVG